MGVISRRAVTFVVGRGGLAVFAVAFAELFLGRLARSVRGVEAVPLDSVAVGVLEDQRRPPAEVVGAGLVRGAWFPVA